MLHMRMKNWIRTKICCSNIVSEDDQWDNMRDAKFRKKIRMQMITTIVEATIRYSASMADHATVFYFLKLMATDQRKMT